MFGCAWNVRQSEMLPGSLMQLPRRSRPPSHCRSTDVVRRDAEVSTALVNATSVLEGDRADGTDPHVSQGKLQC